MWPVRRRVSLRFGTLGAWKDGPQIHQDQQRTQRSRRRQADP